MRILITLRADDVAPRFDLCSEVLIAEFTEGKPGPELRNVLLSGPSGDELCSLILKEAVDVVVCGGIEESFFQYLVWKKIKVIDRVVGPSLNALTLARERRLQPGAVIAD